MKLEYNFSILAFSLIKRKADLFPSLNEYSAAIFIFNLMCRGIIGKYENNTIWNITKMMLRV